MEANPMKERFVRRALTANASFSLVAGISLILFAPSLGSALGVDPAWALELGAYLLPFAAGVGFTARRKPLRAGWVVLISMMDAGWVLATLILVLAWPEVLDGTGWALAAVAAVFVEGFCLSQLVGLRRLTLNDSPAEGEPSAPWI